MPKKKTEKVTLKRRLAKYYLSLKYVVRWNKPLLVWRTFYNYLFYIITGRPRLRYVDLAVTFNCNLNCIHCSATRMIDVPRKAMTVEDYKALGKQLIENGVLVVQLTGGEPLMREDLEDIIRALKPSRFFISTGTNAKLATPERLFSLKKAGLDNLCISIDDWDPAEHDRWRGEEGVHAKALAVLDIALEMGFSVMIFTVATHQNVRSEGFIKLVEYAGKKKVLLLIGWAVPTGNWNANEEVLLTTEDLEYLETIHEKHLHTRTDFESNYFHFGCGAGKEKLYITPYGDVVPCAFVHIRFGNIFKKSLKEIRDTALKIDWFSKYNSLCLAANNREFREKHMTKIFAANKEPISMKEAGFDVEE